MMNIYVTREEIRELDRIAIEEYKIPGVVLMENAGLGATNIILDAYTSGTIAIFCGKGNNGGDGFVIARHLHNKNIPIQLYFVGKVESVSLKSDAGVNLHILRNMGIIPKEIETREDLSFFRGEIKKSTMIVDALLGTGLSGNIRGVLSVIVRYLSSLKKTVIAIDIPSGLDANTGKILGTVLPADITVTFALPKKGFKLNNGPEIIGKLEIIDISIPRVLMEKKCKK